MCKINTYKRYSSKNTGDRWVCQHSLKPAVPHAHTILIFYLTDTFESHWGDYHTCTQ